MPDGPGYDFDPQEKPPEEAPVQWRSRYIVDERTLPLIEGKKEEPTLDPYGKPGNMAGPDRNGNSDTQVVGLPGKDQEFAPGVDRNVESYRVNGPPSRAESIGQTIDGRGTWQGHDYTLATAGAATSIPIANLSSPYIFDNAAVRARAQAANEGKRFHKTANWIQRNLVPSNMSTASELLMDSTDLRKANGSLATLSDKVDEMIKVGGKTDADDRALAQISRHLKASTADDALYSLDKAKSLKNQLALRVNPSLKIATKADDAALFGEEVLNAMDDRVAALNRATKYANANGVTTSARESTLFRMKESAILAGTAIGGMVLDDTVRGIVGAPTGEDQSGLKSLFIPVAVASHIKGQKGRTAAITLAAAGGTMLLDEALNRVGITDYVPNAIKRVSVYDGLGVGAGFAVPTKSPKARMAAVAIGWAAGNLLEMGLSGSARPDVDVQLESALKETGETKTDRSLKSLDEAVAAWNVIGERSPSTNGLTYREWLVRNDRVMKGEKDITKLNDEQKEQRLNDVRELAILSRSIGETRLTGGTQYSLEGKEPRYALKGKRVDIGGYALEYLIYAQSNTTDAIRVTQASEGKNFGGEVVNPSKEVADLQKFNLEVQERIDEITGVSPEEARARAEKGIPTNPEYTKPRNMQKVMEGLIYEYRQGTGINEFYNQILVDTQYRVGSFLTQTDAANNPNGRKLLAKLLRDEATAKMAMAQYQMDRGVGNNAVITLEGTPEDASSFFRVPHRPGSERLPELKDSKGHLLTKGYAGARGALDLAKALDPNNPELKLLDQMYNHMHDHALKVKAGQLRDPKYNPLNVDNGLYRTEQTSVRN